MHSPGNPRQKALGLRQGNKRPPGEKREVAYLKNNAERPLTDPVQHWADYWRKSADFTTARASPYFDIRKAPVC
jgi:hypothetical protein